VPDRKILPKLRRYFSFAALHGQPPDMPTGTANFFLFTTYNTGQGRMDGDSGKLL